MTVICNRTTNSEGSLGTTRAKCFLYIVHLPPQHTQVYSPCIFKGHCEIHLVPLNLDCTLRNLPSPLTSTIVFALYNLTDRVGGSKCFTVLSFLGDRSSRKCMKELRRKSLGESKEYQTGMKFAALKLSAFFLNIHWRLPSPLNV